MKRYKSQYDESLDILLLEKTYEIDEDVDYIYDNYFKDIISKIKRTQFNIEIKNINLFDCQGILFKKIGSEELKSSECQTAHKFNPIDIYLGTFEIGSFYTGNTGMKGFILVSASYSAFQALEEMPYKELLKITQRNIGNEIRLDISEPTIKSSIAHELSHWLNDSIHNEFITKLIKLSRDNDNPDILKLKNLDVNLTYFELDAQIHSIKQLKRDYIDDWNNINLYDLIRLSPSLTKIYNDIKKYGESIIKIWQTNLIKRMNREGLLGKKMTIFTEKSRRYYI